MGKKSEIVAVAVQEQTSIVLLGYTEAYQLVQGIKDHLESARTMLLELEEREGWRALGYDSWRECVAAEFGQSQSYLYRQLAAAKIERELDSPMGEIPERQLRPLAKVPADQRKAVWESAQEKAGTGKLKAKHVQEAVSAIISPPLAGEESPECRCGAIAMTNIAINGVREWRCSDCMLDAQEERAEATSNGQSTILPCACGNPGSLRTRAGVRSIYCDDCFSVPVDRSPIEEPSDSNWQRLTADQLRMLGMPHTTLKQGRSAVAGLILLLFTRNADVVKAELPRVVQLCDDLGHGVIAELLDNISEYM